MVGVGVYFCGSGGKLSVLCKKSPNLALRMIGDLLVIGLIPPILRRSPLRPVWRKLIYDPVSEGRGIVRWAPPRAEGMGGGEERGNV
jgi:hypothetical protein